MTQFLETTFDKFIFKVATDRSYSSEGLWAQADGNRIRIGLSDFLQQRSGDVACAEAKPPQTKVVVGEEIASIETLRESGRAAADRQIEYRDWALERSRAEYVLELRTNLGTSMAETQMAQLRRKQVEYRLALALARLEALSGGSLPPVGGAWE